MKPYPEPNKEGHFWAKLVHPSNMPDNEDWASFDWEVVQVNDNNGVGKEEYSVAVPGVPTTQWRENFIWGPEVIRPDELKR